MKLDLPVPESWDEYNEVVKNILNVPAPLQVRCFKDLSQAVMEIAQGTTQFLSHKKSLAFVLGQTPAFDYLMPHFYKEAFQIQKVNVSALIDVKTWVESLHKDTSFVIFAEDHPVTGEKYSFCEDLDHLLNEKRIHSFRISHARFRYEDLAIRPYSVRLCSVHQGLTVAVCGERFRSPPMSAHRQQWDLAGLTSLTASLQKPSCEEKSLIESFEKGVASVIPSANVLLTSSVERLWDRAVVIFHDVSAEALATRIFEKMNVDPQHSWDLIETTNLCRWRTVKSYRLWWEKSPSDEALRGLLVFSTEVLRTQNFLDLVASAHAEIKDLQSWS